MIDTIDIITFLLLESKYGTELEGYNGDKSAYFLNECAKMNNNCLDLMKESQALLLKSIKLGDEEKDFESLLKVKKTFDDNLDYMMRLSKALDIAVTSKPDKK